MFGSLGKSLGDTLSRFSGKTSPSILGIDISSSTIKVVQLKKKGEKAVLETYGEIALGPYAGVPEGKATSLPEDVVSGALKDLLREAKVTTKDAGISVPMRASLINVIEMPNLGQKRLQEMVPIEVRKYIPVSIQEVMLDWRVIPGKSEVTVEEEPEKKEESEGEVGKKEKYGKVEVLVVAIHKDTINRFQRIVQGAGLNPSFFEIEVFSTIRAILEDAIQPTMIADIGAGNTKLLIVEGGILRKSHIMNRGSQDITDTLSKSLGITPQKAEEIKKSQGLAATADDQKTAEVTSLVVERILSEAQRVLLDFQKRRNVNVGRVIFTGGGAMLKNLEETAKRVFQTEVVIADPFSKLETPAFLEKTLKTIGPEFAVAIGAALRKLSELE